MFLNFSYSWTYLDFVYLCLPLLTFVYIYLPLFNWHIYAQFLCLFSFSFIFYCFVLFYLILLYFILFYYLILFLFCYLVPINSHLYLAWNSLFLKVLQTDRQTDSGGYKVAPQLKIESANTHTDRDIDILTPAALNAALVKLRAICAYKLNYWCCGRGSWVGNRG